MNTKTMEGLVGARTNMNLTNTPMRVFKEARRRGDAATMERALGYVDEFSDKAEEYKVEADKGMAEDAKEAREKAKLQREEAVQKRREEREKLEEKIEENRNADTKETGACLLEISEEGKVLLKDNTGLDSTDSDATKTDAVNEPVTYKKTGETVSGEQSPNISVSV
ncbi:MAG: hypothetical protein K2K96_05070 [Lachnospiraceae bacterium]|nr:hypothetical protein [Lachnospiraceae bacterium]